ncbi:MAG: rhodanese-like domain-containing protein [Peptococcaceae bacterium]|jgi:rhodanese-related sulfurtransferase|nr:rhodanese-like domain-containing protein [Peptococcaceae bacterium]
MGLISKIFAGNTISAREAHEKMAQGGDYVLLDVRTPEEYKTIRIDGATLIPVDQLEQKAAAALPDKKSLILVYCQSGMRATSAVKMLKHMGYDNAVSFGGIMNWPYETVKGPVTGAGA